MLALTVLCIGSVHATKPVSFYSMLPELQDAVREYASRRHLDDTETAPSEGDLQHDDTDWGDQTCQKILMDLTNNFIRYNDTVLHIFRNSGKDVNDYGRYEDCLNLHDFKYFMMLMLERFPVPMTLGLCLPAQC